MNPEAIASLQIQPSETPGRKPGGTASDVATRPDPALFSGVLRETMGTRVHVVRKGENLSQIVTRTLKITGDHESLARGNVGEAIQRVARHNGLKNPDLIFPGQKLDLSPLFSAGQRPPSGSGSFPLPGAALGPSRVALPSAYPVTRAAVAMAMTMATVPPSSPALSGTPGDDPALKALVGKLRDVEAALARALPLAASVRGNAARAVPGNGIPTESPVRTALAGLRSAPPSWSAVLSGNVTVTSDFGYRKDPFTGRGAFHEGIDLTSDNGAEVKAFATGVVAHSGWMPGYGKSVILHHADGTETLYGHCEKIHVSRGDVVAKGTAIGVMGSTGRSTGDHLHFEVRRNGRVIDPLKVLLGERDYGQYYAKRNTVDPSASAGAPRVNAIRRAIRGYSTLPAVTLPRHERP